MQQRNPRPQNQDDRERDLERVKRVIAGDQQAFAEIYDDAFPRVFAFILKRIGDRAEAEDLTQETFVQLYRSLGSFEGRSSLLTWTFGIAHNVCSRYYRHCSRWMVGPKDARTLEERPVEAAVEQQVDAARVLDHCGRVLGESRRPAHREIFHLRYGESRSIREIAERTGKSNEAVKVSLRRSRALLESSVPELAVVLADVAQSA
ncbi:MAG: RNA polymerase sigma factor [Spirochaetaceae bacterium]|nr:RNA polymerase sigma factor [Myxococcales bacterium]MCB9726463.1 RNA polymerase sigma factor [Spirochaetaceae bacterium]